VADADVLAGGGAGPAGPPGLELLGWDARVAALYDDLVTGGDAPVDPELGLRRLRPGRVVRVERSACIVAVGDDDSDVLASASTLPAVGDWVAVEVRDDDAVVRGIAARWSELARRDPDTDLAQVLAANVDLVLITAPGDRPSVARVERETVLAWESGARPVVVLTKSDLAEAGLGDELADRLVGVDVVVTSSTRGEGVDDVAALLTPHRTAVLLGPSGAGKSTLVNALLGEERMATGDVRVSDSRGRHTTTTRQLVLVPSGGVLIDTPGLRSLGLLGDEGIAAAFTDIEDLASSCRFNDCAHDGEPGCAVKDAVARGTLRADRLDAFHKLQADAAFERRRTDPAARRAQQQQSKTIHKAYRNMPTKRDSRRDDRT
jgi:ribosome biogenesis GTPase